jgi:hypothetical protein
VIIDCPGLEGNDLPALFELLPNDSGHETSTLCSQKIPKGNLDTVTAELLYLLRPPHFMAARARLTQAHRGSLVTGIDRHVRAGWLATLLAGAPNL